MNVDNWRDLNTENEVIRPINIKRWDFVQPVFVAATDYITAKLESVNAAGLVISESTPQTPIGKSGTVTHCLKFEMESDLGEELGVGVIFCMKKTAVGEAK